MNSDNKNILKETGNRLPFTVPEGYFEDFALQFEQNQLAVKKLSIRKIAMPWIYMAAMFTGLLLMGNLIYHVYQNNKQENSEMYDMYVMSQLDNSVMIDYYVSQTDQTVEDKSEIE